MRRRVATLVWKEFLELRQMPQLLVVLFVAPVVQLVMLGYAATTDVKHVPIVVVDGDRSTRSRELIGRFDASPLFNVVGEETHPDGVDAFLASGRAWLAVVVPPGLENAIEAGGPPPQVQILADGTDANSAGVALAYAVGLVRAFGAEAVSTVSGGGGARAGFDGRVRVWFNPELVSKDFMVPGVLALLLLVITANLSSMAIVRERELGTLEQLNVTPLGRWELVLGKLLPYGLVGIIDVVLVVLVAVYWFEVPFLGSPLTLAAGSLAYLLCTLGLGLFVSTVSATQQQAMLTATFFFLVPMIYLSGFTFPIENMPESIQWLTTIIPLRYFLIIVRGVFLKGVGFDVLWPQFAALIGWGFAVVALAVMRSRKLA